ncbi:MAG TPA: DUF2203 domain-containing protein [Candidatus Angelobacter sp.]|nr:DUF2203 domain-containing protein [Candidatus Angelobacter sp.]
MAHQFTKHYTREEAQALLPQVRQWLDQLDQAREHLLKYDKRLSALMEPGRDAGGDLVNRWARTIAEFRGAMDEFQRREILIKDLDRGLLDFPAIIGGREVFLCWEKDEDDIEFWHDLDTGYAGRERL